MSRKKDIWNEYQTSGSGKTARAQCNHCSLEMNKKIPTLHNHLSSKHPAIAVKYDHNGNKHKIAVQTKAIWAEFKLTTSSRSSSKYIAKCNHCGTETYTKTSALTSHLAGKHKAIYNYYDSYGNKATRISIRAYNYRSSRATYTHSHRYFSSWRHYSSNTKAYQFFHTLWKQSKTENKLPLLRKEFKALSEQIHIGNRHITKWNAYEILRDWGCRKKIAEFADSWMNGVDLPLGEFCSHIIKQSKGVEKLLANREKRNLMALYPQNDSDGAGYDDESDNDIVLNEGELSSLILQSNGAFRLKFNTKKFNTSPAAVERFALFRLGYDLSECIKYPLPMIAAKPVPGYDDEDGQNMFEWHANLCGPPQSNYEDVCFHFIITISKTYPQTAPKITICSYFEHPNVFGKHICLDMLQGEWQPNNPKTESHKDIGYGWTPAYTMQSILVQLQAFLFDAVDTTYWSKRLDEWGCTSTTLRSRKTAKFFHCRKCQHTGINPWPKPLCWDNRWKYMIPQVEHYDIEQTKIELRKFLKAVNDLCSLNEWYKIDRVEKCGFFNWALLPWYCPLDAYIRDLKNKNGTKSMLKKHINCIRGLVYRTKEWLEQKPALPPNKALLVLKMYRIESALDIALNKSFTNNKLTKYCTKRGYWSWYNDSIQSMDDTDDGKEKEKQTKTQWVEFPTNISLQIEALYLRYESARNYGKFCNWFTYWYPMKTKKVYFKAYVKNKEGKHFVIDIRKMQCRNVEKAKVYKIKRNIKQVKTDGLWKELLTLSHGGDGLIDFDINKKKKKKIIPFPVIDYRKYVGQCAFIDLSLDNLPPIDDENDEKGRDQQQYVNAIVTKKDECITIGQRYNFPEIGEKVTGKVIKIIRFGVFIDIGLRRNAFLHISQIKCPAEFVEKQLNKYVNRKEQKRKQKEFAEKMRLKERKKRKRQRRKNKLKNKNTNETKADDNELETNHNKNIENNHKNGYDAEYNVKAEINEKPFVLPKRINYMRNAKISVGDILTDLYVFDADEPVHSISLTQFTPTQCYKIGDKIVGTVGAVKQFAAFLYFGCEVDGFLHKTALEAGLKNRIVFDCSNNVEIGDKLDIIISHIDLHQNKIQVMIDNDINNTNLYNINRDKLLLPDDFDESLAVYQSIYGILSDDINDVIFQFLDRASLHRCRKVCKLFERIIDDKTGLRFEIEELKCFHTKKTFRHETLGFGVKVERYPKTAHICAIEPKLNLLSAKSFKAYDVRASVWKEPFSHWLPVYINKKHGAKSMSWSKRMITAIVNDSDYIGELKDFNPYYVLKIIPTLMNTMVVRVMKGELHESIVALEGYTMFYHLMLAFIVEYPYLQDFIDRNLGEFIQQRANNEFRDKKHVKSLGEWIALLSASNTYSWRDVCTSYLRECFDRNAKWILAANNALLDENHPKTSRLTKSFHSTQVSLKLCMFHVVFLRMFRYSQRSGTLLKVERVKEKLDALYGRPTYNMRELLQKNVKRIKKINSYKQFFDGIAVKCPSDNELFDWLIESMRNSELKGYHKPYWYIKKKKKTMDATMGGLFDKFDDAGDEWSAKQFGSDVQLKKGEKKKKMSTADQMMAAF